MSISDGGIGGNRQFPTTSWSLILNAQSASPADHARQTARLAETYWRPVYSFIRHRWGKSHDDAKDLTQEFFASVIFDRKLLDGYTPEQGGFRSFLRMAISRFMVTAHERDGRQKRGGGLTIVSLEALGAVGFESLRTENQHTPEQMFDIAWREAVTTEALGLLQQRLTAEGRGSEFDVFKRYHYDGESAEVSYAELAAGVAMTEGQVRRTLWKVRKMFREIVTVVVSGYVENPADLDAEMRALFGV